MLSWSPLPGNVFWCGSDVTDVCVFRVNKETLAAGATQCYMYTRDGPHLPANAFGRRNRPRRNNHVTLLAKWLWRNVASAGHIFHRSGVQNCFRNSQNVANVLNDSNWIGSLLTSQKKANVSAHFVARFSVFWRSKLFEQDLEPSSSLSCSRLSVKIA